MSRIAFTALPHVTAFIEKSRPIRLRPLFRGRISLVKPLNPLVISGCEVLPLVEGGKGISVSNGESSGAWAAAERVLHGVLEGAKALIHGVTCGAGMPYRIAEICASYGVHYYPIVSSGRAFRALWKRAYHKFRDWLGGVVYEDPWLAGGHNGITNSEDPLRPEPAFPRVRELRNLMVDFGLAETPVFMAGGGGD